jgi:NADH-quinone oxidoreductase subunit N
MEISFQDALSSGAVTVLSITGLVVLLIESLWSRATALSFWLTVCGLLAGMVVGFQGIGEQGTAYAGMVKTGGYADFWAVVCCLSALLSVFLSRSYLQVREIAQGEYHVLLLFSVVGMMLMGAAGDLVVLFLGVELMSICFYILAGIARSNTASNESALKYFLLGAFATGFLLYGIALLYGATGTTSIPSILTKSASLSSDPGFRIGAVLLLVGLGFKVAAVPFHMWVPDVYEGAPTTVTALMSTGGKAAAFSAFLLVFAPDMIRNIPDVQTVLAIVSALSMIVGNVMALAQQSVKRMLAYSSIAHAGYILTGVVAGNAYGGNGVLFYLVAYTSMNVGAFGVLSIMESKDGGNISYDDFTGLSKSQPVLASLMALFMFSLTGIPPFAGFFGKYYVFAGAIQAGYTWLAVVGVLMSLLSAYYYLRLVVLMYFKDQTVASESRSPDLGFVALVISALTLILFGIFPDTVLSLTASFF